MKKKNNEDEGLTLVGHLEELRKRIIISLLALVIAALLGYRFSGDIANDIISRAPDMDFVYLSPSELMLSYIRIALIVGLVLSSPIVLSQIWIFVSPGLELKDRRYIVTSLIIGGGFFIIGALFSYELVLPLIFKFFAGFETSKIKATISFASYLSFVTRIVLAFGLVFELPVIMFLIARLGLVTPELFVKYRKYMILVIFVVAAILTPPDVVSQTMLALPMVLLYELGILLAKLGYKRRLK